MSARGELMASGMPALQAQQLGQGITATATISAAGTTQGTATAINNASFVIVGTVAANAGIILPKAVGTAITPIYNGGANTLTIYPAVGEKINNGSANTGITIATGKAALLVPHSNQWIAVVTT